MAALTILKYTILAIIAACTAWEFVNIAEKKGYKSMKYFWWTLFVLPVGICMVIALPDRGDISTVDSTPDKE